MTLAKGNRLYRISEFIEQSRLVGSLALPVNVYSNGELVEFMRLYIGVESWESGYESWELQINGDGK